MAASYYFYMCWKAEYVILIIITTAVDYLVALRMSKLTERSRRKKYLYVSLLMDLGLLFSFKYFNFINDNVRLALEHFNIFYNVPFFRILLPVGISFYTFQSLSYTIDVYNGRTPAQKHPGIYALYVAFFPQLVAGPIERSSRLLPQFFDKHGFTYDRATSGLKMMLWGYFKKIVVADRLAILVDAVYSDPAGFQGMPLLLGTFFFAFQIYCDFSGYSDIAIGSARIMGFELMENFRRPYFAESIQAFWKRWHISLSTWFRDYMYIPLGGNRVLKWRWYYNLMATFVVSGIWHGANWTFFVWGALHGTYLVSSHFFKPVRDGWIRIMRINPDLFIYRGFRILVTFVLVCFAWIFFRSNSISDARFIISGMFRNLGQYADLDSISLAFRGMGLFTVDLVQSLIAIAILLLYDAIDSRCGFWKTINAGPAWLRWSVYYVIIILILFYAPYNKAQNFIYFQF